MTVYARSDVMHVALSSDHGGCGAAHSRPVTQGNPSKVWALDCPACENHLRHDPLWSVTLAEVPETPDEQHAREELERRGQRNRDDQLAEAILTIAGSQQQLPEQLATALRTAGALAGGDAVTCSNGHVCAPGTKFCGECGVPLGELPVPPVDTITIGSSSGGQLLHDANPESSAPDVPTVDELNRMRAADVKALAEVRGVDASGTKADVIARLTDGD